MKSLQLISPKKQWTTILFIALMIIISSCGSKDKKLRLPSATGGSAEILIVTDKPYWEGIAGTKLKEVFEQEQYGLPQPEPYFDLVQIVPGAFKKILQSHRAIFILEVDKTLSEPVIEARRNVWSQPQMVIKIKAPSTQDAVDVIEKNKTDFLEYYFANERTRIINAFAGTKNQGLINDVYNKFKINLVLPTSFYMAVKDSGFCWIRKETPDLSQGILIYSQPYTDTLAFDQNYILNLRNKMCQKYIPGPVEGSYMVTEMRENYAPLSEKVLFKNAYTVKTVGLWKTVNGAFMGGPFVNFTMHDEKNNRVLTIEGFVYSPKYENREYYRQVEAIIHSLSFEQTTDTTAVKENK